MGVGLGSPLCTASRGARLLWCQTVMSSVQGSTMRTIARMSRLFGISKAGCTHSSSLPGQRQGQGGVATEERRRHKGEKNRHWAGRPGTGRQKPNTGQSLSPARTPTHCGSKSAESSLTGVCEGAVVQGRVRNLQRLIPVRRSSG